MRDRRLPYAAILCTVLGMLLLSLIGCASSTLGKSLNVGVGVAASADLISTRRAIDSGRAHEANWFGDHALAQAAVKAIGATGVIAFAGWVDVKGKPIVAHVIRAMAIVGWGAIVIHNVGVAR